MENKSIRVVARVVAQPDKVQELKSALIALVNPTRAERGCLIYELYQSETDPADFVFLEEWSDSAAIVSHMQSAHVEKAFSLAAPALAQPPDIRRYHAVSR